MKIKCILAAVNNACGFVHSSDGAQFIASNTNGEIAATNPTTTVESNTYTFTNTKYNAWVDAGSGSQAILSTKATAGDATAVSNSSVADPYF